MLELAEAPFRQNAKKYTQPNVIRLQNTDTEINVELKLLMNNEQLFGNFVYI